jgi:hypothetical protein
VANIAVAQVGSGIESNDFGAGIEAMADCAVIGADWAIDTAAEATKEGPVDAIAGKNYEEATGEVAAALGSIANDS